MAPAPLSASSALRDVSAPSPVSYLGSLAHDWILRLILVIVTVNAAFIVQRVLWHVVQHLLEGPMKTLEDRISGLEETRELGSYDAFAGLSKRMDKWNARKVTIGLDVPPKYRNEVGKLKERKRAIEAVEAKRDAWLAKRKSTGAAMRRVT